MNHVSIIGLSLLLCACTSQAQLEGTAPHRRAEFAESYQSVFQRLNRGMRNCIANDFRLDAQIYSDLSFGEITMSADGLTASSPLLYAKISKAGAGSIAEFKSLMALSPERPVAWLEYWARGGIECPTLSLSEKPPM